MVDQGKKDADNGNTIPAKDMLDELKEVEQLERKHREGYERDPIVGDEFSVCGAEQAWGDDTL